MDNENDRKLLVLLTYMERNCKEGREFGKLRYIYTDNDIYLKTILDDLVEREYIHREYTTESETGWKDWKTAIYKTTPTGAGAIFSGRFPSERKARQRDKRNLFIGWTATIVGTAGGILGILSAIGLL